MAASLDGAGAAVSIGPDGPAGQSNAWRDAARRLPWGLLLLWLAPLTFLGLFYFYPLASILELSLERSSGGWSAPFIEALTSPGVRSVIIFTFGQAALSTLLTLALGLPGAFLLARYDFPGRSLVQAVTGVSFVLPTLVAAAAFNAFLGPRGWVNWALMGALGLAQPPIAFNHTLVAILTVHVFYNTTIVLRIVGDFWSRLDPRLDAAAQMLGANRWQRLWHVSLPLLAPAIAAASLLIFIFNFSSFGVILILGGPRFATLEVEIYQQTVSLFNLPLAAALALIQLATMLVLTVVYTRLTGRLARPLNLRPGSLTRRRLVTRQARLAAGLYLALLLGLLVLPLVALLSRSFILLVPNDSGYSAQLTLDFYRELTINRRNALFYVPPIQAIGISFAYAGATVLLALGLGLPAAWALASRAEARLNRLLDPLLMLPLGTSAVTLGLGFIISLDRPPLDLRASPILVPLVHTLVAFPFVVRSLTPALRSIRPRLHQAAAMLGASPGQVWREIDLPMIARALTVAATFAFTISLGEFGATALIARPEYPTIPVMIYRFMSQPGGMNYGQALALATILAVITTLAILAIERLRVSEGSEF